MVCGRTRWGNGSARRPGRSTFSLAVGTMLAVILISSLSSAETSPRGQLERLLPDR